MSWRSQLHSVLRKCVVKGLLFPNKKSVYKTIFDFVLFKIEKQKNGKFHHHSNKTINDQVWEEKVSL